MSRPEGVLRSRLSFRLSPKSKSDIRGLLHILWEYAQWSGAIEPMRNPMELVRVKGSSKRKKQPKSLSAGEFRAFVQPLAEPFRTIALVCVCFGLRISEGLALKWSDVDWLQRKLRVERGIVKGRVDETKTVGSTAAMVIDDAMLTILRNWKQSTQFPHSEDWIFASPARLGC